MPWLGWKLALLLACHKGPDTEAVPAAQPTPAPAPAPTEAPMPGDQDLGPLLRALSSRDGELGCAELEALVAQPVAALLTVVETVKMPPAAPMRAAGCLLERHASEIESQVISWMQGPETMGLALLVADRLDKLPSDLARRAAEAGLQGPHAERLRPRLAASASPEIRALLGP